MKYDIVYATIKHQDSLLVDIRWGVAHVGYGQLLITADTHEIIDDECMGEEFCKQIIEYVFNKGDE